MTTAVTSQPDAIQTGPPPALVRAPGTGVDPPGPHVRAGGRDQAAPPTGWFAAAVVVKPLALFVIGLAGLFGVTELTLAFLERDYSPPREFKYWQPAPYIEFYSEPDFHGLGIDTNDMGFRSGPLPREKPASEVRVFFLGPSTGFNGGTNDTTIAGFMERRLAANPVFSGRRVRVINASSTSFIVRQSLVLLVTTVLEYEPDLIVIFHGPGMLANVTDYESRPGYPINFSLREVQHARLRESLEGPNPMIALVMWTRTMRRLHPGLARRALQTKLSRHHHVLAVDSLEQYDPYIDAVVHDVRRMIRVAGAFGCRTLVAVPPWDGPKLMPGAVARLTERLRKDFPWKGRERAAFADATQLASLLDARGLWLPDRIHWTDQGNRLMADFLVHTIIEDRLLE